MSQISLKSISGITSITTPAGVDNVFTVHSNDTTQRLRVDQTGNGNFSGIVTATTFSGSGASLTSIPAGQLTGTVPTARLGSGTASSSTFLAGDSTFKTVTGTTINNNADNRLITGSGSANTLEGESTLTYDSGGLNIAGDSSRDGLKITNAGDHLGEFCVTANRSSANSAIMVIRGEWNNTEVASIYISAGSDTTNKDDGQIKFYTSPDSGTGIQNRMTIDSNGHVLPGTNDTYDLGSSSLRWRDIYTGDLNLSNEGKTNDVDGTWGNYTIQEGENDLFLINNRSGKKYKFNLTEVS